MNNKDLMDAIAIVSFIVGIANYNENLSQSDKDDMMAMLDEKTTAILQKMDAEITRQNEMLEEILAILKK